MVPGGSVEKRLPLKIGNSFSGTVNLTLQTAIKTSLGVSYMQATFPFFLVFSSAMMSKQVFEYLC